MGNWLKTTILMGGLTVLFIFIGGLFGGQQGMIIAFILALGLNFFSYWYSDKFVLKMYRAQEVSPSEIPELYQMVENVSQRAGIPMPKVYLIPNDSPNAFATGRNPQHAVVAVTKGLINLMNRDEIEGVIAHEIAHIKNRDILIGTVAATMAGAVMIIASMARWAAFFRGGNSDDDEGGLGFVGILAMSILAPIAALLIQTAISRSREYQADSSGASFVGRPSGLANALEKLGAYSGRIPMQASAQTAHMFIVNPLRGGNLANLFSTHPPLEERIARLRGHGDRSPGQTHTDDNRGQREAESTWKKLMH
jgi:heat shock protein HtpX